MKRKAVIAVLLAAIMVFGSISAVFADDGPTAVFATGSGIVSVQSGSQAVTETNAKITKVEARKLAVEALKNMFGMEIDEKKYTTTLELRQDYGVDRRFVWQVAWHTNDGITSINLYITLDANKGTVLSFNRSQSLRTQSPAAVATITRDQAQKLAEEFLLKLNPVEFRQTELRQNETRSPYISVNRVPNYVFTYFRKVNGVSFEANFLSVSINGENGQLASYEFNWNNDLKFPDKAGIYDIKKAEQALKNVLDMTLVYQGIRSKTPPTKINAVKLIYNPDLSKGYTMDAIKGEILNYEGKPLGEAKTRDLTSEQAARLANINTSVKHDKEIDSDRAEAVLNEKIKGIFGEGYVAENINYSESENVIGQPAQKSWQAEFKRKDDTNSMQYVGSINIDAETEELVYLSKYIWDEGMIEPFESKITWEQAYDKAIDIIARNYPSRVKSIKTGQVMETNTYTENGITVPDRRIYFGFPRVQNGIVYNDNMINVVFDCKSGEVADISCSWSDDVSFPEPKGITTKEAAKQVVASNTKAELAYILVNNSKNMNKPEFEVKLVYILKSTSPTNFIGSVDAVSGKLVDRNGEEFISKGADLSDKLKGNPAEKELNILAYQNIIDAKSFDASKEISLMELITLLVKAKGYSPYSVRNNEELKLTGVSKESENYGILQQAVKMGMIENKAVPFDSGQKVTREFVAEMLVKLMQYDQLAKAKDIFKLTYKDTGSISENRLGAVAICKGLGIMDGEKELFRPKSNATMQEAALAVYNALKYIRAVK